MDTPLTIPIDEHNTRAMRAKPTKSHKKLAQNLLRSSTWQPYACSEQICYNTTSSQTKKKALLGEMRGEEEVARDEWPAE